MARIRSGAKNAEETNNSYPILSGQVERFYTNEKHQGRTEEYTMLEITDIAAEKLADYMQKNGRGKAVRIKLQKGG